MHSGKEMMSNLIFAILLKYILGISTIFEVKNEAMKMKVILYPVFLILVLCSNHACSQKPNDTLPGNPADTSLSFSPGNTRPIADTVATIIHPVIKSYSSVVNGLLSSNKIVNTKDPAVF